MYLAPLTLPRSFQDPTLASRILKITKNHIDMPALIIQWNDAGFNDVATSPGNRNGVVGQDKNAIINHLVTGGATNHRDTIFVFRDGQSVGDCEHTLPNWYEKFLFLISYLANSFSFYSIAKGPGIKPEFLILLSLVIE